MAGTESSTVDQAAEVAAVRKAFPNRCRVISDSGQFSFIVTVQPEDLDATIKFQLLGTYPSVIPNIAIRSESMSPENISELEEFLKHKAEGLLGQNMIMTLTVEAKERMHSLGLRPGKAKVVDSHSYLDKKDKKKKRQKRKPKSEDEIVENEKLPSMKTSDDVVKRIIWDDNLDKDDFIVGYIDRFRGLVEKYFSAFSWEDLSSVDYDVLAIPKHRIQYFSYKGVKVWDKPRRLDNVFGSANGTKTIDVVMKEIEEAGAQEQVLTTNTGGYSRYESDDSDSSDDDGIVVNIGPISGIGTGNSSTSQSENVDNNKGDEYDLFWQDKLRPNYFICVRITNQNIRDKIVDIQDHLMQQEPLFGECCIPEAALHMTLVCVGLETPEQLSDCVAALNKAQVELFASLPKSVLKFKGTSNFYNRVIYAKVEYEQDFLEFHSCLKQVLSQAGVSVRDGYEFIPHVTIMKTTRPVSRLRGTKNISPHIYEQFFNVDFGEQEIDSVYLCSMEKHRRSDGFYLTPTELHFEKN